MPNKLFTARSNFKSEKITKNWECYSCRRGLYGTEALVRRWTDKRGRQAHVQVCNEECWQDYDHNHHILKGANKRRSDSFWDDNKVPTR